MNVVDSIRVIKDKAQDIDLNTLHDNPQVYFSELVDLLNIIRDMDQPTIININDLKDKVYEG
tara:strand:+ start:1382 stop:1567 length:186 start_codon:yes stop_codon:yes gene_type:complete